MSGPHLESYKIFCIIEGQNSPFPIEIISSETVGDLKDKIKEKDPITLGNFPAHTLTLYLVNILDDDDLERNAELLEKPTALKSTKRLSGLFPEGPAEDRVHVLVQLPSAGQISVTSSQSPVAEIDGFTTRRHVTVSALYERLCCYHFVLVCGTPASGKSTLAQLLEQHIRLKEPSTHPILIDNWPENRSSWVSKLTEMFDPSGPNTIIIDEGQLTYWDTSFWNSFLKMITPESTNRVILFASYGSPHNRVSVFGTTAFVPDVNRVSLRPIDHGDNVAQAGLLLLPDEFHDLVERRCPKRHFKEDFIDYIYGFTAGHVGATRDLLTIVLEHDSYRRIHERNGEYSLKIFHKEFHIKALWDRLESGSCFGRGLPMLEELQDVNIARVFRTALSNNHVTEELLETSEDIRTLHVCFRSGWLHATLQDNKSVFVFTTELHRGFVEYYLGKDVIPPDLIGDNLLLFSLTVIRRFGRPQLSTSRTIGPSALQRPPEARYQDEFYRCCYLHSNGALLSFPEYGNASGRTDFYIPRKKWGIELLRDGDRLEQHSGRFSDQGAYAKDFDMSDYIILDFRVQVPKKSHANIANLYHVVFQDNFSQVDVLDNALGLVDSFVPLNH
ncbi:hypothetical protein FRC17_003081 [Serendipita sp. 399]|nr:hypothetical protein FRC17_003081 [Serendipita sp. 399]